jgi:hypothetical protein
VSVTIRNVTVFQSAKHQVIVLVANHAIVDCVAQNVILEPALKANFVKEMFVLKVVVETPIVQMICLALKENAKIHAQKISAVKRQFAVQQIIVLFVFALTASVVNPPSSAFKSNAKWTKIAIQIKNAFLERAKILVSNEASVESTLNVPSKTVKHLACAFQASLEMQDQFVKSLALFHARKIRVDPTATALIHRTVPNANVNLVALETHYEDAHATRSKSILVLPTNVEQTLCAKWINQDHRVFAHHSILMEILT